MRRLRWKSPRTTERLKSAINYLQRIGRAGRRDGNALNLTVPNGRPHGLFFFAEPKEMIAGHVETPRSLSDLGGLKVVFSVP